MVEITQENPLGMKSLEESSKKPYGELLADLSNKIFKWDWIFSTPLEKIIIICSLIWSIYSIYKWIV